MSFHAQMKASWKDQGRKGRNGDALVRCWVQSKRILQEIPKLSIAQLNPASRALLGKMRNASVEDWRSEQGGIQQDEDVSWLSRMQLVLRLSTHYEKHWRLATPTSIAQLRPLVLLTAFSVIILHNLLAKTRFVLSLPPSP